MGDKDLETPETVEEEMARPPHPVLNPDLPEEGDQDTFEEEPVAEEDFGSGGVGREGQEYREDPNDLSGIDKEFDDTTD